MIMEPSFLSLFLALTAFVVCATAHPASGSETSPAGTEGVIGEEQAGCHGRADGELQQISYQPQVIINPPASGAAIINPETCCDCSTIRATVSSEQQHIHRQLEQLQKAVSNQSMASSEITRLVETCQPSQEETREQLITVSSELVDIRRNLEELHTAVSNQGMSSLEMMRLVETYRQNQEDTQRQLKELFTAVSNLAAMLKNHSDAVTFPKDCSDILERGTNSFSGVYMIQPDDNGSPIEVYCDMETDGGGWTVFQRRQDGSVDFYRDFTSYRRGFGELRGEFWLGNDKLYRINAQGEFELRVDLTDFEDNYAFAEYSTFRVSDVTDNYRLTVEDYSGTAGDSLTSHTNLSFSTKDRDNDANAESCAQAYHGAWWYGDCHSSNLNGEYLGGVTDIYARGVLWYTWKGHHYSLKTSEMKQRKKS